MIKIEGLDKLTRELEEARKALESLDGELGEVAFDPTDPESIEAAIQRSEGMIEERLGRYSTNSIVGPLAEEMKEKYRDDIIARAAEYRLRGDAKE